jgi:hypothetical protein
VHVIVIGPDRTEPGRRAGRLSSATLGFLARELEQGPERCWIACHWPLFRTVMGDPRLHYTSAMAAFYAKPDERIRELLARHRNASVWLSGHTHSPLSAPGVIKRVRLARDRAIVAINTSALVGIGKRRNPPSATLLALPHPAPRPHRGARTRPQTRRVAKHPRPPRYGDCRLAMPARSATAHPEGGAEHSSSQQRTAKPRMKSRLSRAFPEPVRRRAT